MATTRRYIYLYRVPDSQFADDDNHHWHPIWHTNHENEYACPHAFRKESSELSRLRRLFVVNHEYSVDITGWHMD